MTRVGEVFDEEAARGEIADAHDHPGDEQGAEVAIFTHPAPGTAEAGAGVFRGFPWRGRQAVGPETGDEAAGGEGPEQPGVVVEIPAEEFAAGEAEAHACGGAGDAGDGVELATGGGGVVDAVDLREQRDLHGQAEEAEAETADVEPGIVRKGGRDGHAGSAEHLHFGGGAREGAFGPEKQRDDEQAGDHAAAGGAEEDGLRYIAHVKHANGDEHAEGGRERVDDSRGQRAPKLVAEGAGSRVGGSHAGFIARVR